MSKVIKGSGKQGSHSERSSSIGRLSPPQRPSPRGPAGRGPIKREELEARNRGDEIVQQAHAQGEKIRAQAEDYRQRGYQEGYAEGHEEGKALLTQTILELNQKNNEKFANFEPEVVKLSIKIAEKIIGAQLEMQPEILAQIVKKALGALRHQRELYIRVNPEDHALISQHKSLLLDSLSRAQDIDIRPDPQIAVGGCLIESEIGTIEATLSKQLEAIEKILLGE